MSRRVGELPAPRTCVEDCHVIASGPSGSPENADVLPSRRALRAQREAAEAAEAAAAKADKPARSNIESAAGEPSPTTAILPIITVATGVQVPLTSTAQSAPSVEASTPMPTRRMASSTKSRSAQTRTRAAQPKPRAAQATSQPKPKAPRRRIGSRSPVTVLVAIVAIPGLFLTAGLPAYAFMPQDETSAGTSAHSKLEAQAQGVIVAQSAAHTVVSRDGFSASTEEEVAQLSAQLRREGAAAAARASAAEFAISGIRAEGDDYPWPYERTDAEGGGLSPLGYYYRECVDFVAWRLNRDAGVGGSPWKWTWNKMTPNNGDASGWADAWASKGWPTSTTPVVGAVAWFTYNHVAYVQSVPGDGTVVLEEYNWMGMHSYHTRTVAISEVPLYLYPPK